MNIALKIYKCDNKLLFVRLKTQLLLLNFQFPPIHITWILIYHFSLFLLTGILSATLFPPCLWPQPRHNQMVHPMASRVSNITHLSHFHQRSHGVKSPQIHFKGGIYLLSSIWHHHIASEEGKKRTSIKMTSLFTFHTTINNSNIGSRNNNNNTKNS